MLSAAKGELLAGNVLFSWNCLKNVEGNLLTYSRMWSPPPEIPPVPTGEARPFWSVIIPCYNGTNFLGEALRSVLAQDPGPEHMQIAVVDDASTDNPQELVRSLSGTRVEYYRNLTNLGLPENWNRCVRLARGHWVHILNHDDCVREGFYTNFAEAIDRIPNLVAAFCRVIFINGGGHWIALSDLDLPTPQIYPNFHAVELVSNRIWTPSIVVARRVYEELGGYHPELGYACDWEMWIRLARFGPVWFDPVPRACYRRHGTSQTAASYPNAFFITDFRKALDVASSYLSTAEKLLLPRAKKKVAEISLGCAREALEEGQTKTAMAFFWETLRSYPHLFTLLTIGFTALSFLLRRVVRPQHKL